MKKRVTKRTSKMSADLRAFLWAIKPLGQRMPPGEAIVAGAKEFGAICLSCGATDNMIMLRKHKKKCPWIAWSTAHQLLTEKFAELQP